MPNTISTAVGLDKTERLRLRNQDTEVVTSYTGDEPLEAMVWRGGDQPVLFSPTVVWEDPSQGRILVVFPASDTASLEPGRYQVRVLVDGQPAGEDAVLDLRASPGSAPALKAYCTSQDMYDFFSDLQQIFDENDQTGWARQRARARSWTDRVIQANRRNSVGYCGLGYSGTWGFSNTQQTDPLLQQHLDDDKLMLTSQVVEMNARMALAYACEGEIGPNDKQTQWQALAVKNRAEAESIACRLVAQIDTNGDGYAEITINCGMASNR